MAGAGGNHSAEAAEPSLPALPLAACSSATPLFVKLFAIWNSTHRRLRSCTRKSGGRAPVDTGLGTLGGSAAASGRLSGPGAVIVMSCTLRAGLASFPWAAAPPDPTSATLPNTIPTRPEERRVGTGCVITENYRGARLP